MKLRSLSIIVGIFLPLINLAQIPKDSATGKYTYEDVVYLNDDATKKELYTRTKLWMITNLASQESQLSYNNEEAGTIIGNGQFTVNYNLEGTLDWDKITFNIYYTIKVSTKDGKYKYEITNFKWEMISWEQLIDTEPTIDLQIYSLDDWIPNYNTWYSEKTVRNAQYNFLRRIDSEIQDRIKSLKAGILDDDDW